MKTCFDTVAVGAVIQQFSKMKTIMMAILISAVALVLFDGCSRPDSDVTKSPRYNFSSFSGTVWKTKIKIAVMTLRDYRGVQSLYLVPPEYFDPSDTNYFQVVGAKVITVLPIGTKIQIYQLMKDNGEWGGVQVTGRIEDHTNIQQTLYIDRSLFASNQFIYGDSSSSDWGVNPDILEKSQ